MKTPSQNQASATKLQVHVSHAAPAESGATLIDYTEAKLRRILSSLISIEKRAKVADLIEKYAAGKVAIGWRSGTPVFVEVKKDG